MSFRGQLANPRTGYAYDHKASGRLLVTFGSLLLPANGVPVWNFLRATDGMKDSRLFLRDHQEQWYQRGIVEYPSVDALAGFLGDLVVGYKRVLFAGSSMGGFAALLFGRRLGVDVYTINPQTSLLLDRKLGHDALWNAQLDRVLGDRPNDAVLDVSLVWPLSGETVIVYSAENWVDVLHAERMTGRPGVTLVPRQFDNHLLVRHMTQTGEIARVLSGKQPLETP